MRNQKTLSLELASAVEAGDLQGAARALESGASPDARDDRDWPMLFLALDRKDPEMLALLLDRGADPHILFEGVSAPLIAALREDLPSLKLLVAHGADVNRPDPEGDVPLKVAVSRGDLAMANELFDAGADIEYSGGLDDCSILGSAVASGHMKMIELLLERGADPDRRDRMHQLPIDRLDGDIDPERRQLITQLLDRFARKQ
jgi:ankyrin repeat protein